MYLSPLSMPLSSIPMNPFQYMCLLETIDNYFGSIGRLSVRFASCDRASHSVGHRSYTKRFPNGVVLVFVHANYALLIVMFDL